MNKYIEAIFNQSLPLRDIENAKQIMLWAFLWAISLIAIKYSSQYEWYQDTGAVIATVLHSAIGIKLILKYKHFLKELEEMERKIQLDALALSTGATIVIFSSYSILADSGVLSPLSPSLLIITMCITYSIGLIVGRIRLA